MQEGKFYFIKDEYVNKFNFNGLLMKNHDVVNGKRHDRPCFFAIRDKRNKDIFWMVPLSHRIEKYQKAYDNSIKKRGYCDTILIAPFYKHSTSAFLFQNMFPITEKYVSNKYIGKDKKDVVLRKDVEKIVISLAQRTISKHYHGFRNILPDVDKIKELLTKELEQSTTKDNPELEIDDDTYPDPN